MQYMQYMQTLSKKKNIKQNQLLPVPENHVLCSRKICVIRNRQFVFKGSTWTESKFKFLVPNYF